jgi:hypothetical protein
VSHVRGESRNLAQAFISLVLPCLASTLILLSCRPSGASQTVTPVSQESPTAMSSNSYGRPNATAASEKPTPTAGENGGTRSTPNPSPDPTATAVNAQDSTATPYTSQEPPRSEQLFPIGVVQDANILEGSAKQFEMMIGDLKTRSFDSVLFTNDIVARDAPLLDVSDQLQFNAFYTLGELQRTWWANNVPGDQKTAVNAIQPAVHQLEQHPSLKGYIIADEPGLDLQHKVAVATDVFKTLDPSRPATPILVGVDRVRQLFHAARPPVMLVDVNPVSYSLGSGDFTSARFGNNDLDFVRYIRSATDGRPAGTPLWVILQAHGSGQRLREPTPAELQAECWLAIGEGATGIFWSSYSADQGWRGLTGNPELYDEVTTLARRLTPLRRWLGSLHKVDDMFTITGRNKPYVSTLASQDRRALYVVAVNQDVSKPHMLSISSTRVKGQLKDLESSATYSLGEPIEFQPGDGKIFELVNDIAPTFSQGVPIYPLDYTKDVESWWANHPLNPENPSGIPIGGITSPTPVIDVKARFGENTQAAVDALPSTGGTLFLQPGNYGPFSIIGKSNVHVVSDGGAVIHGYFRIYGCQLAADYRAFAPAVASKQPNALQCATNGRVKNIYFKNLIFDGGNSFLAAGTMGAADGVVFDNVDFRNYSNGHGTMGPMDDWLVNQGALISGAEMVDDVWFRGVHFSGNKNWALYLDGCHGCGVVNSSIDSSFSDGALLFMTNDDFTNDNNGNGTWEPDEVRNTNYLVIDGNTFGAQGTRQSMPLDLAITGANVLVKDNVQERSVDQFALLNGKCSTRWPNLTYSYDGNRIIGNRIQDTTVLADMDGTAYGCNGRPMPYGKYEVRDNVILDAPHFKQLVKESGKIDGPNVVKGNLLNGKPIG